MDQQPHLTADHLEQVLTRGHELLGDYCVALNRLNVYPVPDGDTGTNMQLTVGAVVERAVRDAVVEIGHVGAGQRLIEFEIRDGGQPLYPYLISVE